MTKMNKKVKHRQLKIKTKRMNLNRKKFSNFHFKDERDHCHFLKIKMKMIPTKKSIHKLLILHNLQT